MMLMLWFPYDAHLVAMALAIACCARRYRCRATFRRLQRLVMQDRARWL
jgi:hypothetical protein